MLPSSTKPLFLTLPTEIRQQIYQDLFRGLVIDVDPEQERDVDRSPWSTLTTICQVCRTCNTEAKSIFVASVTFNLRRRHELASFGEYSESDGRRLCCDVIGAGVPLTALQTRFDSKIFSLIQHISWAAKPSNILLNHRKAPSNVQDAGAHQCFMFSSSLPNLASMAIDIEDTQTWAWSVELAIADHSRLRYSLRESPGLFLLGHSLRIPTMTDSGSSWLRRMVFDTARTAHSLRTPELKLRFNINVCSPAKLYIPSQQTGGPVADVGKIVCYYCCVD